MTRLLSRTLTLVIVAVLLSASACGGGSDIPTEAEDSAAAERIVLTAADLPGFELDTEEDDDAPSPLDECLDNPLFSGDDNPRGVAGDDYARDNGNLRVQSGALFAVNDADARQAFSDLEAAVSSQCVKDGLKSSVEDAGPGLVVGDVSTSALPALDVADESSALRLSLPLEADDERLTVHIDMTFLREGRVVGGVFTFSAGDPFPEAERVRLTTLVADRMSGKLKNTPDSEVPPSTAAPEVAGGYTSFRDPSGVRLEHPSEWTAEPSTSGADPIVLFVDPEEGVPFRRNVTIILQGGDTPLTLEEYTDFTLQEVEGIEGSSIGESRPTTLSGTPAYRLAYRGDLGSGDLRALSVWTIRDGNVWVVTYTSDPARYNTGLPDFERLLTTIELPD